MGNRKLTHSQKRLPEKSKLPAFGLPVADHREHDGTVNGLYPSVTPANPIGLANVRDRAADWLYCLMDYFDPTAVIAPSGAVVECYGWSAFGQRRVMDADWEPRGRVGWKTQIAIL